VEAIYQRFSMKIFFKKLSVYVLIAVVSYGACVLVLANVGVFRRLPNLKILVGGRGYSLTKFRDFRGVESVDVLFLGSSHINKGIDPRLFQKSNIQAFNLGSPSQCPLNSYFLLKEALKTKKIKAVVVDLYWKVMQTDSGTEGALNLISNAPLSEEMAMMGLATKDFSVYNTMAGIYACRLFHPLHEAEQTDLESRIYIPGGYVEMDRRSVEPEILSGLADETVPVFSDRQMYYLEEILRLCRKNGITVMLIRTPVTREYRNSILNYEATIKPIETLAKKYDVPFLDYNDHRRRQAMGLSSTVDFYDKNHMRESGVVKFNTLLIRDLIEQGIL